jgi:hypothetical protein
MASTVEPAPLAGITSRPSSQASSPLGTFAGLAFIILHLGINSTLINLAGADFFRFALGGMTLSVIVGMVVTFARGRLAVCGLALTVLLLIVCQLFVFSINANVAVNWNSAWSYVPVAAFVLFINVRESLDTILKYTFYISLGYCLVYIFLVAGSNFLQINASSDDFRSGAKVLFADERGARLLLATGYTIYCLFYSLVQIKAGKRRSFSCLTLMIASFALYLSMARFITASVLLVALLGMLGWLRSLRPALAIIFVIVALLNVVGVVFPDWNPYDFIAGDSSGLAREISYQIMSPLVAKYFFLGIGVAPSGTDLAGFIGQEFVFWEDLGPLGMWAAFGLTGLIIFLALAILCIVGVKKPSYISNLHFEAVSLTCTSFGLAAVFSPDLWAGSSAAFVNILLALWLDRNRLNRHEKTSALARFRHSARRTSSLEYMAMPPRA